MPEITISVPADSAHVVVAEPRVTVEIHGVEVADLVNEVGESLLLEQIGREKALTYFGAGNKE